MFNIKHLSIQLPNVDPYPLMVTTFFVLETWLMKYHALVQTPMEMRCLRKLGTMTHMLGHVAPCSKAVVPYGVNHDTLHEF